MQIYCRKCNLHKNASSSGHAAATRSFVRSCLHAFIQPLLPFVHPSVPHEATSIRSIIGRHTSHQHHKSPSHGIARATCIEGGVRSGALRIIMKIILRKWQFYTTHDSRRLKIHYVWENIQLDAKKENNGKQETKDSGINNETSMMLIIIWLLVYRFLLCPSIPAVQQHPSNHGTKYK